MAGVCPRGRRAAVDGCGGGAVFGRDAHGWTWASGALLEDLSPGAGRELWRRCLRASCWRWGLYYSAADRQPDGKPGSAGDSSGAAFGVVLMLFLVPGNALAGCYPREVSVRR